LRIGIIGRTKTLIDSAEMLSRNGHEIVFIYTCKDEDYYGFTVDDYKRYADLNSIPFYCDLSIMRNLEKLSLHHADVCISLNWITLLKSDLFDLFPHGILNAHGGDLPRYRGNACINWAIINRETESCMAIHQMTPELDSGPVFVKRYLPLTEDTYVGEYYQWCNKVVPEMFVDAVSMISKGISPTQQDNAMRPLRCFPRKPSDSQIRWNSDARDIHALVRASSHPFPGAFCHTEHGEQLRIFKSTVFLTDFEVCAVPGQICLLVDGVPYIACSNSDCLLGLTEVSLGDSDHVSSVKKLASSMRNRLV
jgi:methionyl-tRNA formyltransferase